MGITRLAGDTSLKLFLCMIGVLLVGLFTYGTVYVIAPGSLHGRYLLSCDWRNWGLTAQPEELTAYTCFGPCTPYQFTTRVATIGRVVHVGPMFIIHRER